MWLISKDPEAQVLIIDPPMFFKASDIERQPLSLADISKTKFM